MMTPKWRLRFLKVAEDVAEWSKDPGTLVGSLIVTPNRRRVQWGYNGAPSKLRDDKWQKGTRERKLAATIHSEANALLFCPFDTAGCWLFVYGLFPCPSCASMIVQKEISTVVCYKEHMSAERWNPEEAMEILKDGGVNVVVHELNKHGYNMTLAPLKAMRENKIRKKNE
jgi:dCMP deaminase